MDPAGHAVYVHLGAPTRPGTTDLYKRQPDLAYTAPSIGHKTEKPTLQVGTRMQTVFSSCFHIVPTVPLQCPYSALTVPLQCPYGFDTVPVPSDGLKGEVPT